MRYGIKRFLGQTRGVAVYISLSFSFPFLVTQCSLPLNMNRKFPFIFQHKSSQSYTWKAKIASPGLLSHPKPPNKHLPCNVRYATTVHGHFLINAAMRAAILHSMWRG